MSDLSGFFQHAPHVPEKATGSFGLQLRSRSREWTCPKRTRLSLPAGLPSTLQAQRAQGASTNRSLRKCLSPGGPDMEGGRRCWCPVSACLLVFVAPFPCVAETCFTFVAGFLLRMESMSVEIMLFACFCWCSYCFSCMCWGHDGLCDVLLAYLLNSERAWGLSLKKLNRVLLLMAACAAFRVIKWSEDDWHERTVERRATHHHGHVHVLLNIVPSL